MYVDLNFSNSLRNILNKAVKLDIHAAVFAIFSCTSFKFITNYWNLIQSWIYFYIIFGTAMIMNDDHLTNTICSFLNKSKTSSNIKLMRNISNLCCYLFQRSDNITNNNNYIIVADFKVPSGLQLFLYSLKLALWHAKSYFPSAK